MPGHMKGPKKPQKPAGKREKGSKKKYGLPQRSLQTRGATAALSGSEAEVPTSYPSAYANAWLVQNTKSAAEPIRRNHPNQRAAAARKRKPRGGLGRHPAEK